MTKWGLFVGGFLAAGFAAIAWQTVNKTEPSRNSSVSPSAVEVESGGPIAEVVVPELLTSGAQIGMRIYDAKCAACHGSNAAGRNGLAPPLVHKIYEPSHHSDEAFQIAARQGVRSHHWRFGNMPPVEGLTRADVASVVHYVRELQRANGIN